MHIFDETPRMGILRNICYGILIMAIYIGVMFTRWKYNTEYLPGYFFIGMCMSFFGWAGERLWLVTFGLRFNNSTGWNMLWSRILFWAMFGGMAYTIAISVATRYEKIYVQIIPIKNIFFTGSIIGVFFQLTLLQILSYFQQSKSLKK